jgi:hypothetical protein
MGRSPDVQAGARASLSHQRLRSMADGKVNVAYAEVSVAGLCYVERLTSPLKDTVPAIKMISYDQLIERPSIIYVRIHLAQVVYSTVCCTGGPAIWH